MNSFFLDLLETHHARVLGHVSLLREDVHDLVDVHLPKTVLVAVLHEALGRVDHEQALAGGGSLLVDDHNAGSDAGAVE